VRQPYAAMPVFRGFLLVLIIISLFVWKMKKRFFEAERAVVNFQSEIDELQRGRVGGFLVDDFVEALVQSFKVQECLRLSWECSFSLYDCTKNERWRPYHALTMIFKHQMNHLTESSPAAC
jgi:hypothetical protein